LRQREEEWSVGLGESEDERIERLDAVAHEALRELTVFERFMAETGPGSWREGARLISLALVDLTERIHSAIALRLQQTQAIAALLRRAKALAQGRAAEVEHARAWLWNASGAIHAGIWVQEAASSDEQVRLDRWLSGHGGSPLPLVDDEIWHRSLRPRHRPAPPPPPSPLVTADDWDPGDDPHLREQEDARQRLVERLIVAGSAAALATLESFEELRLLGALLWLPRDSAPLRRLGVRIHSPVAGRLGRTVLQGPGFDLEMDNYRFSATTAARLAEARENVAARLGLQPDSSVELGSAVALGKAATLLSGVSTGLLSEEAAAGLGPRAGGTSETEVLSERMSGDTPVRRTWRLPGTFGRRASGGP
jgi:hypothetical protein